MRFGPPVRFARRPDGHNIAYQVFGDAELDLVFLLGYATHLGLLWEDPSVAGFLHKLGSFSRLILLDRLGSGLSDRGPTDQAFEDDMDDVALVLDAVGSQRTALFGCALGGRLALLFAATYPERTSAVVAFSAHPASMRDEDFPWGSSQEQREQLSASIRGGSVGLGDSLSRMAPHEAADPSFRHWWQVYLRSAVTPPEAYQMLVALAPVDIRRLLGSIRVPTLLLHRTGDRWVDVHTSRYMAERIPGARLVELPGDDHLPCFGDQDAVVAATRQFLTGGLPVADPDRVLATVLFTDLVGSTRLASELGDRRWHRTLEAHNQVVRLNLARFRGKEVKTTGDGFLATFDGPARAIRAAHAIRAELAEHGLQVRVGLHAGEVEVLGEDIGGIAVHVAARVMAQAQAGEVLCSRTVKDLVAGAGFIFADRGTRRLKDVADRWQLYAVQPADR
jgi:pimeloyl-ACP methyl ester carboxylesterase